MKKTIVFRIAVFHLIFFVVLALVLIIMVKERAKEASREETANNLLRLARVWSNYPPEEIRKRAATDLVGTFWRLSLIDAQGRTTFTTGGTDSSPWQLPGFKEIEAARQAGSGVSWRYDPQLTKEIVSVAVPLADRGQEVFLHLTQPWVGPGMVRTLTPLIMTLMAAAAVFLLLSVFLMRRILGPLKIIEAYTRKAAQMERPPMLIFPEEGQLGLIADNINEWRRSHERQLAGLHREKAMADAVIASLPVGVMLLGEDHGIEAINNRMAELLGEKKEYLLGKTPLTVLRSTALWDSLKNMDSAGDSQDLEIRGKESGEQILAVNMAPVRNLPSGKKKTLLVFHEITRLRQLEKVRSDFIANLTHELKTPLAALVGISETLLAEKPAKKTTEDFLHKINHHALRLNRLVDDLLILSQIEQGQYPLDFREWRLRDLLDEALTLLEERIDGKKLRVENTVSPELVIWGDRDGLFRIFLNILDNAVKFTLEGRIEITAQTNPKDELAVLISDTGIGIPQGEIPRLGERFFRVDKTRSREMGGAGLGLSIVRHLLQRHGGRMTIESKPASGTRVTLFFPPQQEGKKPVHIF